VNIKILVCRIIGPAAAGSAGPDVPIHARFRRMCEVCNLCKRDLYSLDFVVNRFFNEII